MAEDISFPFSVPHDPSSVDLASAAAGVLISNATWKDRDATRRALSLGFGPGLAAIANAAWVHGMVEGRLADPDARGAAFDAWTWRVIREARLTWRN